MKDVYTSTFATLISDERVNRDLRSCLECRQPLRLITAADSGTLLLAGQCPLCKKVFVIDDITV